MVNPLKGHIAWAVPDNHTISVTLFKDPRTHELEDKDWTFVIEDVSFFCTVLFCSPSYFYLPSKSCTAFHLSVSCFSFKLAFCVLKSNF